MKFSQASSIQYPASIIEYQASRIENHGAYDTISTLVESALQIALFMQNKANFRKTKMNVTTFITRGYENISIVHLVKTKPIQSQSKPIKANSNPIQSQFKAKQSQFQGGAYALIG